MAFRFRKSIRIIPGVRLNFGKTGSSLSLGGKGMTVNVNKKGTRTTLGVPGTGMSYSTYKPHGNANPTKNKSLNTIGLWLAGIIFIIAVIAALS